MTSPTQQARRQRLALLLLSVAQFMVVLDFSIVNVALPSIQKDLGFSTQNLQWVISAYALALGGFLLLGGRLADLYGQRRLLSIGLVLFSSASLAGGLAPSSTLLIVARVIQGIGAALLAPSALSLVATLFAEGEPRNTAFGLVNAVASAAFAAGALLGGLLTAGLGWRWVMFVNVPLGVATLILTPFVLQKSRVQKEQQHLDVLGALTVTGGLVALVYALSQGNDSGWLSLQTLGVVALAVVLLTAFILIERRSLFPLVRLGIFRQQNVTGANIVNALVTGSFDTVVFILTLYMQRVLGYSAFETGLAFVPMALLLLITSNIVANIAMRVGIRRLLIGGVAGFVVGLLLLLIGLTVNGVYLHNLLPGIIVVSVSMGSTFSLILIAATAGVSDSEQGLASGLFNTTEQIGASIMLAIAVAASSVQTTILVGHGEQNEKGVFTSGLHAALLVCVVSSLLAFLVVFFLIRKKHTSLSKELPDSLADVKKEDILETIPLQMTYHDEH